MYFWIRVARIFSIVSIWDRFLCGTLKINYAYESPKQDSSPYPVIYHTSILGQIANFSSLSFLRSYVIAFQEKQKVHSKSDFEQYSVKKNQERMMKDTGADHSGNFKPWANLKRKAIAIDWTGVWSPCIVLTQQETSHIDSSPHLFPQTFVFLEFQISR